MFNVFLTQKLTRLTREEGEKKKTEGKQRAEKNGPPSQKRKKRALTKEKKRRAERGRVPKIGKFPKKHVFFSQKLASEAKKVLKKKKEGGKRALKKNSPQIKTRKRRGRAQNKKTAGTFALF